MNRFLSSRRPAGFGSLNQRKHHPDYWLVLISAALLVLGLVVVYSISPALSAQKHVGDNYYVNRQMFAIALGIGAFLLVSNLPVNFWRRIESGLLVASGIAAIAVRVFGDQVNGAYRWIQVGGFSFQAAELIKFAVLIWLAGFLADRIRNREINNNTKTLKPIIIAIGIIGVVVGIGQKDLGSTGVLVLIMVAMGYIAGLPLKRIMLVGGALAIASVILILPFSYRRDRLSTFLHPAQDCLNTGYQSCQALITVGSGGIIGKGLGRGVQAYGYLPEAANDSIFAIFAEKFGFVGTAALLGLFVGLFSRLKRIMERAPDDYSRLLITGVLAWLSTQTIINIGAMIGLLPLKGITLPFISYGGTSVLFIMAAIGMAFQVSRYTTYRLVNEKERTSELSNAISKKVEYRNRDQ